jgi:hypothetical protein
MARPHDGSRKICPCCFAAVKVGSDITDSKVAQLIPLQDGVIPIRFPLAFRNRADQVSRPVAKPFHLAGHQIFQNKMRWEQPVEFPAVNAFD